MEVQNIILCSKQDCTGCLACYNACAQGAITLVKSEEDFVYPEIDQSKCVSCGMCAKACPILNKPERTRIEQECFAAYVKDNELRKKSSSGGEASPELGRL
jgi:formate hydrogenlyase subunit 6/NADH:ubiquinone oxidoreductase subunit I